MYKAAAIGALIFLGSTSSSTDADLVSLLGQPVDAASVNTLFEENRLTLKWTRKVEWIAYQTGTTTAEMVYRAYTSRDSFLVVKTQQSLDLSQAIGDKESKEIVRQIILLGGGAERSVLGVRPGQSFQSAMSALRRHSPRSTLSKGSGIIDLFATGGPPIRYYFSQGAVWAITLTYETTP